MDVRRRQQGPGLPLYSPTKTAGIDNPFASGGYTSKAKPRTDWTTAGSKLNTTTRLCFAFAVLSAFGLLLWLSSPILASSYRREHGTDSFESEKSFMNSKGEQELFPSLMADKATVSLSVIVPAYNEEDRMPAALAEMVVQLKGYTAEMASQGQGPWTWEIIIVDDGSKDSTAQVAQRFSDTMGSDLVRFLKLEANVGKGGAVRKGMMRARGQYLLFADADGATRFADFALLLREAKRIERDGLSFALGSRAHLYDPSLLPEEIKTSTGQVKKRRSQQVRRSPFRQFMMRGFHFFASTLVGAKGHKYYDPAFDAAAVRTGGAEEEPTLPIRDTQCGFKLFSRHAARLIFPVLHIERWAFDVELVLLATRKSIPLVEVPVGWQEVAGSKVKVISATLQMARDIVVIRACYSLGIWQDSVPKTLLIGDSAELEKKRKEAAKADALTQGTASRFEAHGDEEGDGDGQKARSGAVDAMLKAEEGRKTGAKRSNAKKNILASEGKEEQASLLQ